jgi:lysophospholipase L1-like esterase
MKYLFLTLALLTLQTSAKGTKLESTTPVAQTAAWAQKWWMPRHLAKLEEKKQLGDVQLVFIGDSITHAWENKGKRAWKEYYAKYNALNLGYSGDRTEHVLWRLENGELDGISPKAIVLMIGTNNVGHRKEESVKTAAGIKAILDTIAAKQPKAKVLLLAIFPRGANNEAPLRKLNDATNQIIQTYADGERVIYLNINDKFLDKEGNLSRLVMPDLLHPIAPQYKVWAEAIAPTLDKMLK